MRVVAVDPGKTTGTAWCDFVTQERGVAQHTDITALVSWLTEIRPDVVVMETFRPRRDKALALCGQDIYASEIIGVVKMRCLEQNIPLAMQIPATKDTVRQALLTMCGLWNVTKGLPHARDAAKHLVVYALKNKLKIIL